MLLDDVQRIKQHLDGLIMEYLTEGTISNFTAKQLNWPGEEDVVQALRKGQTAEAIYGLLRQFVSMHRNNPLIVTNAGRALYIDYNGQTEKISLYVGASTDLVELSNIEGQHLYALLLELRFDFAPNKMNGLIKRTRHDAADLVQSPVEHVGRNGRYVPALYFYVSDDPTIVAQCTLRCEWLPQIDPESKPSDEARGDVGGDAHTKVRQAPDPRLDISNDDSSMGIKTA